MRDSLLHWFQKILNENKIDCSIIDPTEKIPYPRALISLGVDTKERPKILEVIIQEQENGESVLPSGKGLKKGLLRIQFQAQLPFSIAKLAVNEVSHLLHFLNRFLELPGFEMSELDDQIFFRYIWFTTKTALTPDLALSIIGIILMNLDLFALSIENVSSGKKTYSQLLEDMLHSTQQLNKPNQA